MTTAVAGIEDLARQAPASPDDRPQWWTQRRRVAAEWIAEHGFPSRHDEDWRYLGLQPILSPAWRPASGPQVVPDALEALAPDLGGPRLVFVNGLYVAARSRINGLPKGVVVTSVSSVLSGEAPPEGSLLGDQPAGYHDAFSALNATLTNDGAFVQVPAGVEVAEPIQLVFLSSSSEAPVLASPRSMILAGPGSRAAFVEISAGISEGAHCTNAVTEIICGEDAEVAFDRIQDESESAFHLSLLDVRQARRSRFTSRAVNLGGAVARQEVRIRLEGEDAEVTLDGLYLPRGEQYQDHPVLVDHAAPRTTSRQRYRGVVDDRGHGVFNGRIIVRPGADGTDADQSNRNLLLSDRAEVDTRPRLEIYADDVKCAHGATVGRLDEDALFYLRSRGIPEQTARALLVQAFADDTVGRFPIVALRTHIAGRIAERASAGRKAS